jgi:hypothetical protein
MANQAEPGDGGAIVPAIGVGERLAQAEPRPSSRVVNLHRNVGAGRHEAAGDDGARTYFHGFPPLEPT